MQIIEFLPHIQPDAPTDVISVIPGPTSLWELFKKSLDPVHCQMRILLALSWDDEKNTPETSEILSALSSNSLWKVRVLNCLEGPSLNLLEKKISLNQLESIVHDLLNLWGIQLPNRIQHIQSYEFIDEQGQPDLRTEILESLEKVLDSELSTSVFDSRFVEFFVLPPGKSFSLSAKKLSARTPAQIFQNLITNVVSTEASWLERPLKMARIAPRMDLGTTEIPSLARQLQAFASPSSETYPKFLSASFSPQTLHSKETQFCWYSSAAFCPTARTSLIPSFLSEPDTELLIPNVPGQICLMPPPSASSLYFLGPFHRNNHFLQNQFLLFLNTLKNEVSESRYEILHPQDAWLRKFAQIVSQSTGWYSFSKNFASFTNLEEGRGPLDYGLIFFSPQDPLKWMPDTLKSQVELLCLGKSVSDLQKFQLESLAADPTPFEINLLSLKEALDLGDSELSLEWRFAERMSPAYGFERASIFPDQFLLKTNLKTPHEVFLNSLFTRRPPFSQSLRAAFRKPAENSKKFEKYFYTNETRRVSAFAETGEEIVENPVFSGINLVDNLVRKLLCGTCQVPRKALIRMSIGLPKEGADSNSLGWAALFQAFEGIFDSLRAYEMSIFDIDVSPYPVFSKFPEIRMQGDAPSAGLALPFDGFRMFDEVVFALGPKPAFVDVGSEVLKHVRVVSNYVTNLDTQKQIALYDLISEFIQKGTILSALRVGRGGIAETLVDLGIKGDIGVQVRPSLSAVELFSGSPGRILVGVAPQDAKNFEKAFPSEYLSQVGVTHGQKILGASLTALEQARMGKI